MRVCGGVRHFVLPLEICLQEILILPRATLVVSDSNDTDTRVSEEKACTGFGLAVKCGPGVCSWENDDFVDDKAQKTKVIGEV